MPAPDTVSITDQILEYDLIRAYGEIGGREKFRALARRRDEQRGVAGRAKPPARHHAGGKLPPITRVRDAPHRAIRISASAWLELADLAEYARDGTEIGGLLYGTASDHPRPARIGLAAGPGKHARRERNGISFSTDARSEAEWLVAVRGRDAIELGSWHTHPGGSLDPSAGDAPSDLAAWRRQFLRIERDRDAEQAAHLIVTSDDEYRWREQNLQTAAFVVRRAAPGREFGRQWEPLVVERVAIVWDEG
jgi:hypothetical protein